MTSGKPIELADKIAVLRLNATRLYSMRQIATKTQLSRRAVASIIQEWAATSWNRVTESAKIADLELRS